jgi:hypothetical protein
MAGGEGFEPPMVPQNQRVLLHHWLPYGRQPRLRSHHFQSLSRHKRNNGPVTVMKYRGRLYPFDSLGLLPKESLTLAPHLLHVMTDNYVILQILVSAWY